MKIIIKTEKEMALVDEMLTDLVHPDNPALDNFDEDLIVELELPDGEKRTYFNSLLHDLNDQPAVEGKDFKEHYKNGQLHNNNGPAKIKQNGKYKAYFKNGKLHREDGPAVDNSLNQWYFLNGQQVSKEEIMGE